MPPTPSPASAPTATGAAPGPEALAALRSLLEEHGERPRELRASLLSGGRSNLTYTVTDGHRSWVLRRPPLGHVLATAHDMGREYRVMAALATTPVPVPRTVLLDEAGELLGAPCYIMDKVEGTVLRDGADLDGVAPGDRARLAEAFVDALADLHTVDPAAVGLADLGRPDGYLERQVRRWRTQLAASRSRELHDLDRLAERLAQSVPPSRGGAIVHGDFRLDNAILDHTDPARVLAVLDWEMATMGDPLADLALFALYWEGWAGLDNPFAATPTEHGFPTTPGLLERYARRTGATLDDGGWYAGFAYFKFAAICEGIHYRHVSGLTVGEGFDRFGAMVPELARRGVAALGR
ncbi:phosphotransferase family protein [Pseudonocardia lutea]|uniref:Phosphotransferase family protein n=1 Tax=Pseudonocardia lutea TaxID=2172015 RepID=A0ABW1IA24_9PSEU